MRPLVFTETKSVGASHEIRAAEPVRQTGKESCVKIDTGSTAWMLASTALVLLMTPGLAFFYGGMTRAKSTLNMMMMSWVAIITVTIAWVLYGDSLSFSKGNGFIGGFAYLGEHGLVGSDTRVAGIPDLLFSVFQLTSAVITVALIS